MKTLLLLLVAGGCTASNPEDNSPHALGTIILGEVHPPGGGSSSPIVSAGFIPDAAAVAACQAEVAGCVLAVAPTCMPGCAFDEYCTFDGLCNAYCQKACTRACNRGEICVLDGANQPTCILQETFDAGPLAFSGTTTAITLFPPYAYTAQQQGAPFLAGAQLEVQAQGASGAGFAAFDETYTATSFLQTLVPLDMLPRETVFGPDSVPIDWAAGGDRVVISLAGAGGAVTCNADDGAGHYDIPREAVNAAVGMGTALSLTVQRERKEIKKGKHTQGPLAGAVVQPQGWLELVTMSSESASFTGCGAGKAACGSGSSCTDLTIDPMNCGGCGVKCAPAQICVTSQCVDADQACNDCYTAAMTGDCRSQNSACVNDAECAALRACLEGCTNTTCQNDCFTQHSAGQANYQDYVSCVCNTACQNECGRACSGI
jgi:hypothetical protein